MERPYIIKISDEFVRLNNSISKLNSTIEKIGLTTQTELNKKIEENKKKDYQIRALEYRQGRFVGKLRQLKSELNEFYKTNTTNESCISNIIPSDDAAAEETIGGKKTKRKTKSRKSKVYSIKKVFKNKTIKS
jgi:septation ring formation regulator EzrA